jgi:hypothetical protein
MKNGIAFSGMAFWGSEFLPKDIMLDANAIRHWAVKSGMITDPELQLVTDAKIDQLGKIFASDDTLLVLIHIYENDRGKLCYFEYPFVPVKTLIKKKLDIKLAYWTRTPDAQGPSAFGVKFGFWLDGDTLEYASSTSGKLIIQKFNELFQQLEKSYPVKNVAGRVGATEKEIEVNGDVTATFSKVGRIFDVKLAHNPSRNKVSEEVIKKNIDKAVQDGKFKNETERALLESFKKNIEDGLL